MLFRFLRTWLRDDEYLETDKRLSTAETQIAILQKQIPRESDKVDIEFIALLWVMILAVGGFISFVTQFLGNVVNDLPKTTLTPEVQDTAKKAMGLIYTIIFIPTIFFMWNQISFGLDLLKKYGEQRENRSYLAFAKGLRYIFITFIITLISYAIYISYFAPK
jgi:hypothetical protein